jgi:hypothetical protein
VAFSGISDAEHPRPAPALAWQAFCGAAAVRVGADAAAAARAPPPTRALAFTEALHACGVPLAAAVAHAAGSGVPLASTAPPGALAVVLPWTTMKLHARQLALIGDAVRAAVRLVPGLRVEVRLSPGVDAEDAPLVFAMKRLVDESLGVGATPGVSTVMHAHQPFARFLRYVASADVGLDAFPYGGCNSVHDMAHGAVPMVVLQGEAWRNRVGPAMLRRVGLAELVARSEAEFAHLTTRLLTDDAMRLWARWRLAATDLSPTGPWSGAGTPYDSAAAYPDAFAALGTESSARRASAAAERARLATALRENAFTSGELPLAAPAPAPRALEAEVAQLQNALEWGIGWNPVAGAFLREAVVDALTAPGAREQSGPPGSPETADRA